MTTAVLKGIGVSAGSATGPVARMAPVPAPPEVRTLSQADVPTEVTAARHALGQVAADLERRAAAVTGDAADVLSAQALMVADPVLGDQVEARIRAGADGVHAIADAFGEFRAQLEAASSYFAERVADLDDLRDRSVA
ncbi:MAG: phosphoenolpyruvate-utilizing N-terminal domain-containing protein, partial [Streptomyces sp.]